MTMAIVAGSVVGDRRADGIPQAVYLLVDKCDSSGRRKGDYLVALDPLGAGTGEMVLLAQGSSCRWTPMTDEKPIDTLIVGIVDMIDQHDQVVYRK